MSLVLYEETTWWGVKSLRLWEKNYYENGILFVERQRAF